MTSTITREPNELSEGIELYDRRKSDNRVVPQYKDKVLCYGVT